MYSAALLPLQAAPRAFVGWYNQKMVLICSPPSLFSSCDTLMLSLFHTGSDLLSNTCRQPTPETLADVSQQTCAFISARFCSSPFSEQLSWLPPVFFLAHLCMVTVYLCSGDYLLFLSVFDCTVWVWFVSLCSPHSVLIRRGGITHDANNSSSIITATFRSDRSAFNQGTYIHY